MAQVTDTLKSAQAAIEGYFDRDGQGAYNQKSLSELFEREKVTWELAAPVGPMRFLGFLLENGILQEVVLESDRYAPKRRYVRGKASTYQIALSLTPRGYLSHATALHLNGITVEKGEFTYVNREQGKKYRDDEGLTQKGLDLAFKGKQRVSQYVFKSGTDRIMILSGKHTDNYAVVKMRSPSREMVSVASLPRTLVDIAVRPNYAGGIGRVLDAYKASLGRVSGQEISQVLTRLDYLYPYHQSIGFMLERCGFPSADLVPFAEQAMDFDFYLVHGMGEREYDPKWRIFYPKLLES